jgi:hypothetical protein
MEVSVQKWHRLGVEQEKSRMMGAGLSAISD